MRKIFQQKKFLINQNDSFWVGFGLTAFLFSLPLSQMILQNRQSLFLGNWDWLAFFMMVVFVFCLVPFGIGGLFLYFNKKFKNQLWSVVALFGASLFARQFFFYSLSPSSFPDILEIVAGFFVFSLLAFCIYRFNKFFLEIFKIGWLIGLISLFLFGLEASPKFPSVGNQDKGKLEELDKKSVPIFFITCEKLALPYFVDEKGAFLKKRFPKLTKFINDVNYYPESYASSASTLMSLQTLYTGIFAKSMYIAERWEQIPNIKSVFAHNREFVYISDILKNLCDPNVDSCYKTLDVSNATRLGLITGWTRTYFSILVPEFISKMFGGSGWEFDPRNDMWATTDKGKGGKGPSLMEAGKRQFKILKDAVRRNGGNPVLYVMHNWMTDSPKIDSSILNNRNQIIYSLEIRTHRKKLSKFDKEFGDFINLLKEKNIYDKSLIILTADTGYDPFSRKLKGEDTLPASPELLRVLMAIKWPYQKKGRVIKGVIRQYDVFPTLLKYFDLYPEAFGLNGEPVFIDGDDANLKERPVNFYLQVSAGRFEYALDETGKILTRVY